MLPWVSRIDQAKFGSMDATQVSPCARANEVSPLSVPPVMATALACWKPIELLPSIAAVSVVNTVALPASVMRAPAAEELSIVVRSSVPPAAVW